MAKKKQPPKDAPEEIDTRTDKDLVRELKDDYQMEKWRAFWQAYGKKLSIVFTVVVLALIGWSISRNVTHSRQEARSDAFDAAVTEFAEETPDGKNEGASSALTSFINEKQDNASFIGRFVLASKQTGAEALATYQAIYTAKDAPDEWKALAILKASYAALASTTDTTKSEALLQALDGAISNASIPFRTQLMEAKAYWSLKLGNIDAARGEFTQLSENAEANPALRERAKMVMNDLPPAETQTSSNQ